MLTCHSCAVAAVTAVADPGFKAVTSDSRPWRRLGPTGVCGSCGLIQKVVDDAWRDDCARIYASYEIYHQAAGSEQLVFDAGRATSPRSVRIIEQLDASGAVGGSGRLLDVGCGNGAFLRAFGARHPAWRMSGSELSAQHREAVEAIPGVEAFHAGDVSGVSGPFDLVIMNHVLEHVPHPRAFLAVVRDKLGPRGRLVVHLPDLAVTPFDVVVADHATHFTGPTLAALLTDAGLPLATPPARWVPKEVTAVATRAEGGGGPDVTFVPGTDQVLAAATEWLSSLRADARGAASDGPVAVFGTSIAGTWIAHELGDAVGSFVDEDPDRIGGMHMGRPIVAPADVPPRSTVVVALVPGAAARVAERLTARRLTVVTPRPLRDGTVP